MRTDPRTETRLTWTVEGAARPSAAMASLARSFRIVPASCAGRGDATVRGRGVIRQRVTRSNARQSLRGSDAASVCTVGPWSSFGLCSAACGGGRRSRTRAVTAQLGATCSLSLAESDGCNEALCPAATAASTRAFVLMTVALHGMSAADFAFENRDAFRAGVATATG